MSVPDTPAIGSPDYYLEQLNKALDIRCGEVAFFEAYYEGRHRMPDPNPGSRQAAVDSARRAWNRLAEMSITNMCGLVADAPNDRLEVKGFRFGDPAVATAEGDKEAWRLWQGNQLDADSELVHGTALRAGEAFVLVWPNPKSPVGVDITLEHPSQAIVAYRPGSRREVAAALKRWVEDDGFMMATLYMPDQVYKYRSDKALPSLPQSTAVAMDWTPLSLLQSTYRANGTDPVRWVKREVTGETWPLKNPFGEVPMTEFPANPTLKPSAYGGGTSEFAVVIPDQDRLNKTMFDRLVTAEDQAFKQRWIIGWDYPTTKMPDGTEVPDRAAMMRAAAANLWTFNSDGQDPTKVQVGEFGQADFTQFIKGAEFDIRQIASKTKTPPSDILAQLVNISGDALTSTQIGLVSKARRHSRNFGERWEKVMRLALKAVGNPKASDFQSMIIWGDFERRTWGETVDAVGKIMALPDPPPAEVGWLMLPDVGPQDVERWKSMKLTAAQVIKLIAQVGRMFPNAPVSTEQFMDLLNRAGAGLTGPPAPEPAGPAAPAAIAPVPSPHAGV